MNTALSSSRRGSERSKVICREEERKMEVGFLGLGIMGKAMAMNLLKGGFKVTVWNRTLSKVFTFATLLLLMLIGTDTLFA